LLGDAFDQNHRAREEERRLRDGPSTALLAHPCPLVALPETALAGRRDRRLLLALCGRSNPVEHGDQVVDLLIAKECVWPSAARSVNGDS
jgi:hypothetical protein